MESSVIKTYLESLLKLGLSEPQKKYYQWILQNGQIFPIKSLDHKLIQTVFKTINPVLKQCFRNSLLSALTLDFDYVEGYYLTNGLVLEHAWNSLDKESEIMLVDSTAALFMINNVKEYFGVKIPKKYYRRYLKTKQEKTLLQFYYLKKIKENDKK